MSWLNNDTIPRGYKNHFHAKHQLSTKFIILINVKMPTIVGILTFISIINTTPERLKARNLFVGILAFMSIGNFVLCWYFCSSWRRLCGQVVGISVAAGSVPVFAGLFLFCYERDFVVSLSDDRRADIVDAYNAASGYLDECLNIGGVCFDNMVGQVYPSGLQLGRADRADTYDTESAFLYLRVSISGEIVSSKICDKCDGFGFEVVDFPFVDGDVPRSASCGVCVSQLTCFTRTSSYVADIKTRNYC